MPFGSFSRVIQTTASGAGAVERRFPGPLRAWEIGFLALLVAGLLAAFWVKSRKEYLGHDEFITAVLAGSPSLPAIDRRAHV